MKRKTLIKSWSKSIIQNLQTENYYSLLHLILPLATPILQLHLTQISTNPSTTIAMGNCFRLPRPKPESRPNQALQYLAIEPEPDGVDVPKGPEVHPEAEPEACAEPEPEPPEACAAYGFAEAGRYEACGFVDPKGAGALAGGTDLWLEKFKIKSLNFDDVGGDRGVDAPVVVKNGGGGGKK